MSSSRFLVLLLVFYLLFCVVDNDDKFLSVVVDVR